ncbi:MAG: hypothetical protein GF344_19490 [Chitinivibrionales bacterium]|nr:hypothetical protein [Chitinivibrionales bacterium]MBD3358811.1 hypothetical protein [Chitinivibrionales bacterium]
MSAGAVAACQFLFNVPAPVAKKLLPKLEPRDVRVASNTMGYRDSIAGRRGERAEKSKQRIRVRRARTSLQKYICRRRRRERRETILPWGYRLYHHGPIEPRVMRFGQYLYRRGAISLGMLEEALAWQSRCRPRMGQIAMREGMISPREFALLLCFGYNDCLFGESAKGGKFLDDKDIAKLKAVQESYRRPLGRYFVIKGMLDERRLESYHDDMVHHNLRFAA